MPGRRFSRRSKKGVPREDPSYATSLDDDGNYVTQPPRPKQGLTGKISTLFRQKSQGSLASSSIRKTSSSDAISVSSRNSNQKRIFYSSHQDDDSDDSYESRVSQSRQRHRRRQQHRSSSTGDDDDDDDDETVQAIVRYRGFSTSIQSLFLDEPLVCASMGCFGLILSNRTEYLLELRNERRGLLGGNNKSSSSSSKNKKTRLPSRIVAYALIVTVLLMFGTFLVWGFGTSPMANEYVTGYDYYEDGNNNNNDDDDDNAQQNNDDNGDFQQYWDDYLQNNDDAAVYNNNDDAANNNYNAYNNNDAANNNYNAYNNDDQQNNDDAAANQDDAVADDFYDYGNNRWLMGSPSRPSIHPMHGIFKIRDYNEHLWIPLVRAVQQEWKREAQNERRRAEETDEPPKSRDTGAMVRMALLATFLFFLAVMGRRRRMRTRFYIVRARAQEDHLYYASSDEAAMRRVRFDATREDQYEGACSHTLCGCYPVDEMEDTVAESLQVEVADDGVVRRKKRPFHEDVVARGFNCLMAACCGFLCKCWCQCLSICALAQEAREIRLLLPPRYQRIDFITHQPFHEYQKDVNDLRRGWMGQGKRMSGFMPHYNALSRLSRYIIVIFVVSITAIMVTLFLNPRAVFSWQDAAVLLVTFVQSFLVISIVHGIFHKSDLSLDAVVKLFAAGFLIAVPSAVFFEGLIVNIMLFFSWVFYLICDIVAGAAFSQWVFNHWRLIWMVGELFNAYVVAAITEEMCKYYTFRAVEHPDLVFITGLQREEQDETAVDGGLVKYPFASHQVQKYIRDDDASVASGTSRRSSTSRKKKSREQLLYRTGTTDEEFEEDDADVRTFRQKAMAITTGMICIAVGLACAENFLYVFVLGGATGNNEEVRSTGLIDAWFVLFFRSLFPVHALAAAMQSINMIRKFVESDDHDGHRIGIGRVILPAVILHGSFDAVLMVINVFVETSWDVYFEQGGSKEDGLPYNPLVVNVVAGASICLIMITAVLWYIHENRSQRLRLILLEEREKALVDVDALSKDWNSDIPKPRSPSRLSQMQFA